MAEIEKYPLWLERELSRPAGEGSRNDQLIKIGPELLRRGHDVDSLFDLFCDLQPTLSEKEVMGICKSAARYVVDHVDDTRISASAYMKQRRELTEISRRAQSQLPRIIDEYRWLPEQFTCECAQWSLTDQRKAFISELFEDDDVIWIGEVWETGEREKNGRKLNYRNHFKTAQEWLAQPNIKGEFTAHCTFKPGSNTRSNDAHLEYCYLVVESDVLPIHQMGAIFNFLAVVEKLTLRAIVSTGGKSVHGWFDWPKNATESVMAKWGAELVGLSCDPATLKPSQPVRLPGCVRKNTKRPQQLLYLA